MEREIPHPSARFFMGFEDTTAEWYAREEAAMEDDVFIERVTHLWPLMNFNVADARWKLGQTAEVELYALCGARLRSYMQPLDSVVPIEFGDHWRPNTTITGGRDVCEDCLRKHDQMTHRGP